MINTLKYVGLDVSKEQIAVAIADEGHTPPRYLTMIPHTSEAIRSLVKRLGDPSLLRVCYEAGPTGYGLYRFLSKLNVSCEVIAPSLIPQRPGDRVKTDKRDAVRLAQLYRSGELTSIHIPTEDDEALRDLVRCREDAVQDQLRAKHRLSKILLRHEIRQPPGMKAWSAKHRAWLDTLKFDRSCLRITLQEYYQQLKEIEARISRLEEEISHQATDSVHAPMIQALQGLKGIALITSASLVAEIGSFERFASPRQLMAYAGLVPSESSSGDRRRKGEITKTGNSHVRRLLIESAWSYRYQPAVKGQLKKRLAGLPPESQAISWKAQHRLHKKYYRLVSRGKEKGKAVTAVARELAGFVWAMTREVETS